MGLGIALVAQQSKAQALARHLTQLLLDRFDRLGHARRWGQLDREQAGEPAHSAGQVDAGKQVFTAVAFQLDQGRRIAGPAAQGAGQRGQQQVIDLRAIRRRRLLQQVPGLRPVQAQAHHLAIAQRLAGLRAGMGQPGAGALQLLQPVVTFCHQCRALCIGRQLPRPVLQGAGFFCQGLPGVSCLQVFKQHPPRHAVHHQVVNYQQQTLRALLVVDQHRAQQRPVVQRQTALRLVAQGL